MKEVPDAPTEARNSIRRAPKGGTTRRTPSTDLKSWAGADQERHFIKYLGPELFISINLGPKPISIYLSRLGTEQAASAGHRELVPHDFDFIHHSATEQQNSQLPAASEPSSDAGFHRVLCSKNASTWITVADLS